MLVDLPQHLVPDPMVWWSPEEPRVPVDAHVEIGYGDTGEKVRDRAHLVAVVTLPRRRSAPPASWRPARSRPRRNSDQGGSHQRPCISASHRSDATPPRSARWFGKPANRSGPRPPGERRPSSRWAPARGITVSRARACAREQVVGVRDGLPRPGPTTITAARGWVPSGRDRCPRVRARKQRGALGGGLRIPRRK